jgi:hypothetical protein
VPVRRVAEVDCPPGPPRSWLIFPFETPSSTAASPTESCAAKRRRNSEVSLTISAAARSCSRRRARSLSAAAYPDTVDAVFRKVLRRRDFTWAEPGETLMRRRKAWYYRREPRPGVTVIGDRLVELASGGRR